MLFISVEIQKRRLVEKKFNYDSTNDIVPDGNIKEVRRVDKHPLPFTIRKAEEKAAGKSTASKSKSRLTGGMRLFTLKMSMSSILNFK